MYSMANCTVSVLRGTVITEFGDEADVGNLTPIATGLLAQVLDTSQVTTDPATQTPRTIRRIEARMPSGSDIREGDRLRRDSDGQVFSIQELTRPAGLGFTPDLELQLRQID